MHFEALEQTLRLRLVSGPVDKKFFFLSRNSLSHTVCLPREVPATMMIVVYILNLVCMSMYRRRLSHMPGSHRFFVEILIPNLLLKPVRISGKKVPDKDGVSG